MPASVPWDQYPHLIAIPVFAKGLGAARTGDFASAERAIEELVVLQAQAAGLGMVYDWGIQVAIQETALEAWVAFGRNDIEGALGLMRQAADMESSTEKNPVTPGEVLPAGELYGDMLMENRNYAEARAAYEAVLERSPNRFLSIFGAGYAAELSGDEEAARDFYSRLLESANPMGDRAELSRARGFLAGA